MGNASGRETVKHHHHNKHDHKRRHHAFKTRRHRHTHYGGIGSKLNPSYTAEPSSKTRKRRRETEPSLLKDVLKNESRKGEIKRKELEIKAKRKSALERERKEREAEEKRNEAYWARHDDD